MALTIKLTTSINTVQYGLVNYTDHIYQYSTIWPCQLYWPHLSIQYNMALSIILTTSINTVQYGLVNSTDHIYQYSTIWPCQLYWPHLSMQYNMALSIILTTYINTVQYGLVRFHHLWRGSAPSSSSYMLRLSHIWRFLFPCKPHLTILQYGSVCHL